MKNIISIIVIIISVATFILVVQPQYTQITEMQKTETELRQVLDNANRLQSLRDELIAKRQSIPSSDIRRLEKLIPESADNVRLILEFEQISNRNNLTIQNASAFKDESSTSDQQNFDIETNDYGVITLDFTLQGSYTNFINFLGDIERNLRITDIQSLSISPSDTLEYTFDISIDTYWLKDNI